MVAVVVVAGVEAVVALVEPAGAGTFDAPGAVAHPAKNTAVAATAAVMTRLKGAFRNVDAGGSRAVFERKINGESIKEERNDRVAKESAG